MNLRSIDLNLLVILDALLDEAHVSRAAHRLNLSQPAVSNALQRCRDLFADPLLERGRGTMRRTPMAETLRAPLRSVLTDVESLVNPAEVPLDQIEQVVRITAADDPTALVARPLVEQLSRTAPGITLVFRPWQGTEAVRKELLDGTTDLAIAVFPHPIENIDIRTLREVDYLVAMRRDHPASKNFDLDAWLNWPHVVVSGRGDRHTPLDIQLAAMGRQRRIGLVVPSFQLVPSVLAGTNMMAMLPRPGIEAHAADDLTLHAPPVKVDTFPLHLARHMRQSGNKGLRHVSEMICALL